MWLRYLKTHIFREFARHPGKETPRRSSTMSKNLYHKLVLSDALKFIKRNLSFRMFFNFIVSMTQNSTAESYGWET